MLSSRVVGTWCLALAASAFRAQAARAEMIREWLGAGTAWNTSTPANWSPSGAPGAGETARFSSAFTGSSQPQVQIPQSTTVINGIWIASNVGKVVTITRDTTATNGLTLTPTDTINGIGGLGLLLESAFTMTLNLPIALGANQEWRNNSNTNVALQGANAIISGGGNLTLRSTVSDLASAFRADARLFTFTGQLTIAEGVYRTTLANNVSANGPLGNSANAVILGETGGKLGIVRVGAASQTSSKPFTLADGGRGGFWVDHDTTTPTLTLSGKISGGGTLVKLGARDAPNNSATTLELTNGNNEWTGGTLITDGYVSISAANRLGEGAITLDYQPQYIANAGQGHSNLAGLKLTGDVTLTAPLRSIVVNGGVGGIIDAATSTNSTLAGDGALSGAGALQKTGMGSLKISGNNAGFSGPTTVSAGTLLVNGSVAGNVNLTAGVLGGTGTIGGNVNVTGGTLAPGASIESLDIGGNLSLTNSTFQWEFNSTALSADVTSITHMLSIGWAASLMGVDLGGSPIPNNTKFTVIAYGEEGWNGGLFTGESSEVLNDDSYVTVGGKTWLLNYNDGSAGSNGGAGNAFVTLTAVPEPNSVLMMALGCVFAIGAAWRGRMHGWLHFRILGF